MMTVNIFGSSGVTSKGVDTKYIDNKFIVLTTQLNTKVHKRVRGNIMIGTLDKGDNKVVSSYVPLNEDDLVNKKYSDSLVISLSDDAKVNKSGDVVTGN